jgi:hypothetical protein
MGGYVLTSAPSSATCHITAVQTKLVPLLILLLQWEAYAKFFYILGSVLGWDTMLQAGRSRVRLLRKSLDFELT